MVLSAVCIAVFGAHIHELMFGTTDRAFSTPRMLCQISDEQVNESSGIAADPLAKDLYYTHNDSGDIARFFAFNTKGEVIGKYLLRDTTAFDWEEMASSIRNGVPYLYFGDIGDNLQQRTQIVIHRVAIPKIKSGIVDVDQVYTCEYPDGAKNAEAMFVNPKSGDIYLITKTSKGPAGIYKLRSPRRSGAFRLSKAGELSIEAAMPEARLITGAAISPDAKRIIVRTYLAAYEYEVPSSFDGWYRKPPVKVTLALTAQGEAICYSNDGKSILTTSEGSPCPVHIIDVK